MVESIPKLHTPKASLHSVTSNADVSAPVGVRAGMPARAENIDTPTAPAPNDSASFSSRPKEESFVKKHWGVMLLGAAALAASAVLSKGKLWAKPQAPSLEKIHQNLAEIFGKKDLTKEQAEAMLKKYREISQIKDKTEYIKQLFAQVKQDLGYGDNNNIYLTINTKLSKLSDVLKHKSAAAAFSPETGELIVSKLDSKQDIFANMLHEFTHSKQHGMSFRASNARTTLIEKYVAGIKKDLADIYKKAPETAAKLAAEQADETIAARRKIYGDLPIFKEGSEEDIKARKYLDAWENYTKAEESVKGYKNNLLEREAFRVTEIAKEIFRHISAMK